MEKPTKPVGATATKYLRGTIARMFGFDREIRELREKCGRLLWDSNFGVHSRAGLDELGNDITGKYRTVAFIDFDGVHELNKKYGYEEVNRRISATLREISKVTDIFVARWFSGDELVVLSMHDAEKTERLVAAASLIGLVVYDTEFTYYVEEWNGKTHLNNFIDSMSHKVADIKRTKAAERQAVRYFGRYRGNTNSNEN